MLRISRNLGMEKNQSSSTFLSKAGVDIFIMLLLYNKYKTKSKDTKIKMSNNIYYYFTIIIKPQLQLFYEV